MPKEDFRSVAQVVVGSNCSGPSLGIRDYSYHPDYSRDTFSTLAMIQLETDTVTVLLRPICPPPPHFKNQHFFAMVLSDNCRRSKLRVHKMRYVSPENCKLYYRRTGLDVDTMWPSHTACARSIAGGWCVWRSGAILVVKVGKRWRLLGFGVYGPGCQAPARFLDYGKYHDWVTTSVKRIGRPAITTLGDNHLILRRSLGHMQRYGPCDREETTRELYTDSTVIPYRQSGVVRHNVTLIGTLEYSCVIIRAQYSKMTRDTPKIRLRRYCLGEAKFCYGFQYAEIHFFVEITFQFEVSFGVQAYGRQAIAIDPKRAIKYLNGFREYPNIPEYERVKNESETTLKSREYPWFGNL
nr:uncharacterized protein LOC126056165 isoform X2 [Helicoverpa armigera]